MPPRRSRTAVATAPLIAPTGQGTGPTPPPRKTTTGQLRLPPSRRRKAQRLRNALRTVALAALAFGFLGLTGVAGAFGYLQSLGPTGFKGFSANDLANGLMPLTARENVLVLGTDYSYAEGSRMPAGPVRSDAMMVASMDPISHKLTVLSIPRDTRVIIRGHYEKINAAYAIGGPDLAMKAVGELLGVPVKHWLQLNPNGLEQLVDVLGGVKMYVERDMYYVDETAHLGINIHKGWHQMNGKQAHGYVRFRHDEMGDIGRIQRQQQFLRATAETVLTPTGLLKVPQLLATIRKNIHTNLDGAELMRLGAYGARLGRQDVKMVMLPGEFSGAGYNASYWLVDPAASLALGKRLLGSGGPELGAKSTDRAHVKITVLNGTPNDGIAAAAARDLRSAGWNVWSVGDAPRRDATRTRVINEIGQDSLATKLGHDLGVRPERVDASIGDVSTDFTVIIGSDWAKAHTVIAHSL